MDLILSLLSTLISAGFQVVVWFLFVWIFASGCLKLTISAIRIAAPNAWLRFAARKFSYKDYYLNCGDRRFGSADELKRIFTSISKKEDNKSLTILEIGCGGGVNFEFFPAGSSLLMLDVNPHCEQHMLENLENFPRLHLKAFVCGSAEHMHQIDSESVDVVVSSRTLCSVDESKTLKEVHRVLRKRGRFVFEEHVVSQSGAWRLIQKFLARLRVTQMVCFGCRLDKNLIKAISEAGFDHINYKKVKPDRFFFHQLQPHIVGVATKQHGRV